MLFDWLVTGQIVPMNPAAAVRGPKHVVKTGTTPVLEAAEWRKLVDSIPTDTLRDLRDRALIATLTYSFARITAALTMKVEDLRPRGGGWTIRLHEKGGKEHAMTLPPRARRRTARLHRCRRYRRGPQGLPLPDQPEVQRQGADRPATDASQCLADDPPARHRRRHHGADRLPHVPRDGDHESIRVCGAFTPPPEQRQRHCRSPAVDTIARREAGACHRACAFGSAAASARRVLSTASADAWRNAC